MKLPSLLLFVFLVLYGYINLIYNADSFTATSFYEYVDPSEGQSSVASFVSISSTLAVKGFHLLAERNGVDAFASVVAAQNTTTPSPTESLEDASKTEKEGDVQPTASEMPLPKREVVNTPKPTPSIPTVGVHTATQAPNTTGRVVSKEPAKAEQAPKKEVKKELLFVPPRLINRTRFEREVWRLPPELKHIGNTVEIFNRTLLWEDKSIAPGDVISTKPITSWFSSWKSRLRVNCKDSRDFAVCQVHVVVSWDSDSRAFRAYQVQPCTEIGPISDA